MEEMRVHVSSFTRKHNYSTSAHCCGPYEGRSQDGSSADAVGE